MDFSKKCKRFHIFYIAFTKVLCYNWKVNIFKGDFYEKR